MTTVALATYLARPSAFNDADDIIIQGSADEFRVLSPAQITQMGLHNVDQIDVDAGAGVLSLSVAQAAAFAPTNIIFTPGDTITVSGTNADLQNLTPTQILSLAEKGLLAIVCSETGLTLSVAQAIALASTGIALSGTNVVTISGTADELKGLGAGTLDALSAKGVAFLDSTTDENIFNLARFNSLGTIRLTDADTNRLEASSQEIAAFGTGHFDQFRAKGIDVIFASNGDLVLSLAQFNALGTLDIGSFTDVKTLRGPADTLQNLTTGQIGQLHAKGINRIDANEGSLSLSLDQASALAPTNIVFANDDVVSLTGLSDNLKTLTPVQIAALNRNGFDKIDATDNRLNLSAEQAAALAETSITFAADDAVKLIDTKLHLESLTPDQIAALNAKGLDIIDCSPENAFSLSIAQADALLATTIALSGDDTVTLVGSVTPLSNFLTAETIGNLGARGVKVIDVDENLMAISVDLAVAMIEAHIAFADNDSVALVDWGATLDDLLPGQIAALEGIGITAIDAVDDALTLGVEQAGALAGTGLSLSAGDTIVVSDDGVNFQFLSAAQIGALAAMGVDTFHSGSPVNPLALTLEQFNALGGITLSAVNGIKVTASGDAFAALTPTQFEAFAAKGVNVIDADNNALALNVAQFNALGTVGFADDDTVILLDAADALRTLDENAIQHLADKHVTRIESTGNAWSLTVAAANKLATTQIALSDDDMAFVSDTADALRTLTTSQITALGQKGFDVIDVLPDANGVSTLTLGVEQAATLAGTNIILTAEDRVVVADTASALELFTVTQIDRLGQKGVDVIDVVHNPAPGTSDTLHLSVDQAQALAATNIVLMAGDDVVVAGSGDSLHNLSADEITRLGQKGVKALDATGNNIFNLSVDQARALADTPIILTAADEVSLNVTLEELQTLTGAQISALRAKGVDHINITNPTNETFYVTVAQLDALAGVDLSNIGTIALRDRGAVLGGLSPDKIAQLVALGVDSVDAANDVLVLSAAQLSAFGAVPLAVEDSVTLLDTSAWLVELTEAQIRALDVQGVDRINVLDDEWDMTIAQAKALATTDMGLFATDDVTLKGTAAEVATLSATDITVLDRKHLDMIDVSGNALTLDASQAAALAATASLKFSTGDVVTVSGEGGALAAFTPVQIAALSAKGVDVLDASNNQLTLSIAQVNALGNLGLTADDVVTLSDTGSALAALTAAQIAALSAKGVDALDASDNQLTLSIAQVNALGNLGLTADDVVTLSDTGAALAALTAAQITALSAKGVDVLDASDNQLTLSVAQLDALGNLALAAGDTVTLSGTGAALAGLTDVQIAALDDQGIDGIDASDNSIALSLSQFNALGTLNLAANDVIKVQGTLSADVFAGTGNNEAFFGSVGNDVLRGGGGDDTLYGGAGKDVLTGGAGKDTFVFDTAPNKLTNLDQITDFNVRDDGIWLDNAAFRKLGSKGSVLSPAKLNKAFLAIGSVAKEKDDYLIYNNKTGVLSYDADGSGAGRAIEIAKLAKGLKLTAADFFVV